MPDGLLCPNDLFAIGLMDHLRVKQNIKIPDDIAVVGFDDIPMAGWDGNALTTVRLPIRRMAERTADTIARHIEGYEPMDETLWIPCRIVARSTA
jgi:DNA-binding LacI/PurR family transcriptional regulator